jgi:hypothetical protein
MSGNIFEVKSQAFGLGFLRLCSMKYLISGFDAVNNTCRILLFVAQTFF